MPGGQTSLQLYTPTVYTAQVASAYKSNIDGNSSILGNPAGRLYVYPNNPAGMSVLVDPGFNLLALQGSGLNAGPILFNTAASPVAVSLTAPGANSYYATIYWNPLTNVVGVVYGATSSAPFPILPDDASFQVLACVLLNTGMSQVQANNIYDVRNFWSFAPVRYYNAAVSGTVAALNCAGATSVYLDLVMTGTTPTVPLTNLQVGIPVFVVTGSAGASRTLATPMTTPGGVSIVQHYKATLGGAVGWTTGNPLNGVAAGTFYAGWGTTTYEAATPTFNWVWQ